MKLKKKHFHIAFVFWVVLLFTLSWFVNLPFFVKFTGQNYLPQCEELQTEVIKFLSKKGEVFPVNSKLRCKSGKLWSQLELDLIIDYNFKIEDVLRNLKRKFGFSSYLIQQNKKFSKYSLYYKGLPIQVLRVYKRDLEVAIIFDDVGENINQVKEIINLNIPVTVSILPFLIHSKKSAILAKRGDLEVMLHLPLEPHHSEVTPGIHTITTKMNNSEIIELTEKSIKSIPFIKGVNNHMGSKATESKRVMDIVLDVIKRYNLYFIDSRTSSNSVGFKLAKQKEIPTDINKYYLDNEDNKDYIDKRLELFLEIVKKQKKAIAIGHSRNKTIVSIKKFIPEYKKEGIEFVTVSKLLD